VCLFNTPVLGLPGKNEDTLGEKYKLTTIWAL